MQNNFQLFVPLDVVKSTKASDDWVFEGIASTEHEDLFGEVVYPDNFAQSIDFFRSNGKIYFDHLYAQKNADWLKDHGFTQEQILSLKMPIGKPLDAQITDEGLYIKAVLNKEHPLSSFVWNSFMKNSDARFHDTMGLSIGAKYLGAPRREYNIQKAKYVTYLPDLLLYEVSVTPEPVNPYTKTWAHALKSMMEFAEATPNPVSYHTIVPDEVIYDEGRDVLVVKSTVTGKSGETHVFESYIDVKEDIEYLMPKNTKRTLKALPGEEEETLLDEGLDLGEELGEDEAALAEAGEELADDVLAEEGGEEDLLAEGGDMDMGGAEADVDGLLDSLVGDEAGDEGAPAPVEDDTQSMILDKLDSILDVLQTVADLDLGTGAEEEVVGDAPGAGQVSSVPPTLKSTQVELSEASTERFGTALKGILDGWEDRVVAKIIDKLTNETTVVKSTMANTEQTEAKVIHPGVSVDDTRVADSEIVQKSVVDYPGKSKDLSEEQQVVLKSLIEEYVDIRGYGQAHAQKRGRVLRRAEETLGVSQPQFYQFVRDYENK